MTAILNAGLIDWLFYAWGNVWCRLAYTVRFVGCGVNGEDNDDF